MTSEKLNRKHYADELFNKEHPCCQRLRLTKWHPTFDAHYPHPKEGCVYEVIRFANAYGQLIAVCKSEEEKPKTRCFLANTWDWESAGNQ